MSKAQWMQENLKPGEIYAGLILGKEGQPDHHLFLLEAKPATKLNWEAAKAWAASVGGELPTRSEQSLLFANAKEQFEPYYYWSGEQDAGYPSFAWMQYFNGGNQYDDRKSSEYRARAVRRSIIE
ncbi:hypothetical protein UNDYM_1623 [Undibacterium sp. YM2]|uniref:DUF1566 domain-containing protein n=1 Tax=Undibacterium sp. YM2 TaxID=2058625 RepID=UPI001331E72E|nr:DUF1566 domain-containing protein [Undibacterium sp. YM2]BBB65876.1 hypothetical protein UNDYM_1623 [Undibacterium sp. YM2]